MFLYYLKKISDTEHRSKFNHGKFLTTYENLFVFFAFQ